MIFGDLRPKEKIKDKEEQKGSESNKFGNYHTSKADNQVALTCA